ncbi:MAG: PorT family protein [Treponema sp.]|nr:PorT family protein [Treponema sp.]
MTEVAIMPFVTADDAATTLQLYNEALSEMGNLGSYLIQEISIDQYPAVADLRPDIPPDSEYLGTSEYVLTGEFYLDMEDLQHFQLWLWTSDTGRLVYTDEMVTENFEEALMYMPPLLNWIFAQIPQAGPVPATAIIAAQESSSESVTPAAGTLTNEGDDKRIFQGRLYLGLRGGMAFNSYSIALKSWGYEGSLTQSLGYETAFFVDFQILRFFGIQGEVIFSPDALMVSKIVTINGQSVAVLDQFDSLSLTFPLLIKIPLDFGVFNLAFYAGGYGILPLEETRVKSDVGAGTYAAITEPPFGFIFGLDMGFLLGPGMFVLDMRYSKDFGITTVKSPIKLPYTRDRLSASLGYKFLLWKRK